MERIHEIDFTKGILIIFMVLYHSLNYLSYGSSRYNYLAFLPPSFIMISGFIITHIYLPKYGSDTKKLNTRLVVRSLKLFLIFIFLNLLARMIFSVNHYGIPLNFDVFYKEWFAIYLVGSTRMLSFEILLPISYILLISTFVLRLQSATRYFISFFAIIIFSVCILTKYYDHSIYNLNMVSFGVIGMLIGQLPINLINGFAISGIKLLFLCVLYVGLASIFGDTYIMQMFFTVTSLLIIYAVGIRTDLSNWLPKQTILLGQYSLLSYIIQILYLQLLFFVFKYLDIDKTNTILTFTTINILMWGTVFIVNHARQKYRYIDLLYKVVFA